MNGIKIDGGYAFDDSISYMDISKYHELFPDGCVVVLLDYGCYYPTVGWFDPSKGIFQGVWSHDWQFPNQPKRFMILPRNEK